MDEITSSTDLMKLTPQFLFDYSTRKVWEQGRASWDAKKRSCVLRGPQGTRCAVGWLIPDNLYNKKYDEDAYSVSGMLDLGVCSAKLRSFIRANESLLTALQTAHDSVLLASNKPFSDCARWGYWFLQLRNTARVEELSPAVIDELAIPEER